ncbi:hypothetical protein [Thermostichus sp. MS-CIW-25]
MNGIPSWLRQLRRWLPWVALLLVLVLIGYWVGPRPRAYPQEPELPTLAPLPQHPRIRVVFNQSRESTYRDPYRQIRRYGMATTWKSSSFPRFAPLGSRWILPCRS